MQSLVIIPTYNERENLPRLIPAILRQGPDFQVLVVDDSSPDGTGALAEAWARRDPRVRVLHRDRKDGLGGAYLAGFDWALARDFDCVFEMDADFSHDPADLPRLAAALGRADVAIGSRWTAGGGAPDWPLSRTLISRGGSLYARLVLGLPIRDLTSGFKGFRRAALASLDRAGVRSSGYGFQIEVNYRLSQLGCRIAEVPIRFIDRRAGQSKMSGAIVLEALRVCLALRLGWARRDRSAVTAPGRELVAAGSAADERRAAR